MKDTIVLDLKKVSDINRAQGKDKEGNLKFDSFKSVSKDLFAEIHENTELENQQLEKDLRRSKIIIDDNGKRVACSNITEFLDNASSLTTTQKQYILNVGHQGLFGGGSASIALISHLGWQKNLLASHDTNKNHDENKEHTPTDDIFLCVYIQGKQVKIGNTNNFSLIDSESGEKGREIMELSLVADISNLEKGKEKDLPIHMIVSQRDKRIDITGEVRKIEEKAEVHSDKKVKDLVNFIEKIRYDKAKVHGALDLEQDQNRITQLSKNSMDENQLLEERQNFLNSALKSTSLKIPLSLSCEQEMEAKIYHHLTGGGPDKEAKRMQFGTQKVVEYIASFEGENAIKNQKPAVNVVSNILSSLTDDKSQQKIIQKNAPMILRQVTDSKDLSFGDRVKKLFDTITMAIRFDGKGVKQMVENIKIAKDQSSGPRSFVKQAATTSNPSQER